MFDYPFESLQSLKSDVYRFNCHLPESRNVLILSVNFQYIVSLFLIPVVPRSENSLPYICFSCKLYNDTECKFCQLSFSLRRHFCNRTNCILEILLEWVSFCGMRIMTIITKKENFTAPMRKRIKTPHPISLTSRVCNFTDDFFSHFRCSPPQHFFLLALSPLFLVS